MVYCDKEYIGKVIKQARKNKNLKQSQLAEMVGMSEKHLSKIESGKNYLVLDNFLKIAEILDLSMADFGISSSIELSEKQQYLQKIINTASDKQLDIFVDVVSVLQKYA